MKVLLVNTSDHAGGAAIAALRLLKALHAAGVDATLLCRDRTLPAERTDIVNLEPTVWRQIKFAAERAEIFAANGFTRRGLFSVDTARLGNDITSHPLFKEADVIHLHWTNQAMLSLRNLRKILESGKRVVWTMHDMWPFTGVCHQAGACQKWMTHCTACPQLQRPSRRDLSFRTFERKQRTYSRGSVTFVGCSRWLSQLAASAPLLRGQQVVSIPNPIDTEFYSPAIDSSETRQRLGLPLDKRILLFTAFKLTDPNKGIDYLIESIALLLQEHPELRGKIAVALAGKNGCKLTDAFGVPAYDLGYITDEAQMRDAYRAADLLLMPTLMDNLPNTIVEAMACGVPCVGFNVGGLPQMIDNGLNGYLADYCNSLDFANGIARMLLSTDYAALCRNARTKALDSYSERVVAQRYTEVYNSGLHNT